MQLVRLRAQHPTVQPKKPVDKSVFCPADSENGALVSRSSPEELGMPYGLPPLSQTEMGVLSECVARGAPGPSDASLASRREVPPQLQTQVRAWEAFLNIEKGRAAKIGGAEESRVAKEGDAIEEILFKRRIVFKFDI